ncbi:HdeD family acid-resistance protein [Paracoccus aminophilus]|uniref:HdeD family acid-resistance protein n=1 Tax=Paracoccus aminophilus JCM 7686 TaxID=1367847 RepID=S5XR86_PARAH|nr:HdeD family acid-resistance protein [Paracoccus aminophilus]AGT07557.1 hypothetical protein JCM7686_0448 [Paracoccus aminophilus JCM 7686]
MENQALRAFADYWWVLLIRGIAAVIFGLIALFYPGLTAYVLLLTFGIYALVDGVMAIIVGFRRKGSDDRWWSWLIDGALSIIIGLMAIFWPIATALAILFWIGAWAVVVGILRLIAAIKLRHEIEGEWALGLSGILMVIWGVLLFAMPVSGILSLTWLFGIFALLAGITMIVLSFRVRKFKTA